MIPRYSRNEIRKIWEPENKFKIWLDIEIAICEALEKIGVIPKSALKNIKTNSSFKVSRIDQIEKELLNMSEATNLDWIKMKFHEIHNSLKVNQEDKFNCLFDLV